MLYGITFPSASEASLAEEAMDQAEYPYHDLTIEEYPHVLFFEVREEREKAFGFFIDQGLSLDRFDLADRFN